jgi:aryl-alcohol dehydrogenase
VNITAAVAREADADFVLEHLRIDAPRGHEVLVEIKGVGLCHTDLAARDGVYGLPYPIVLGHEGSGVVRQVGDHVTKVKPGDHVAVSFNSCGECGSCRTDDPAYCHQFPIYNYSGRRPDGTTNLAAGDESVHGYFFGQSSFATHALATERNVVKVEPSLPIEILGPLGCGIQTGAGAVMRSMACEAGSSILILGAGPVGLAAVMGAAIQGCADIVVSEPHAARRELALKLGATAAIDPSAGALPGQVRAIVPGGVNYAFDTTGNVDVLQATIASLANQGMLGLVGVPQDFSVNLPLNLVQAMQLGLTVKGIVEGDSDPDEFIPELLRLYQDGRFPFDEMVQTFPFTEINEAVAAQHRGDVVKVVLVP